MSLLDGLILDHLLQNVVKTPVYIAIREDLKNDPNALGAGTIDDPYDGSKTAGGVYKFDTVMRLLPAHSTIILFPGEFWTQGYLASISAGFAVKKGWRIMGSGWAPASGSTVGPTLIKLAPTDSQANAAFRWGTASGETVDGFELASLGIDCGFYTFPGLNTTAGAVDVNGSNIRIRDIRVTNFGAASGATLGVISAARVTSIQNDVRNVVVSDCVIESPHGNSVGNVIGVLLAGSISGSTVYEHVACVVRDNSVNMGSASASYTGVSVTGGKGAITEQNSVWNCGRGFYAETNVVSTDLVVRDNYFSNVIEGVAYNVTNTTLSVGRIIIEDNVADLITGAAAAGINLTASASATRRYTQAIIRRNTVRHNLGAAGHADAYGIKLDTISTAICDENLIDVGPTPAATAVNRGVVRTTDVGIKTFNNRTTAGKLLACSIGTGTDPDLAMEAENWLIAV